MKPGGSFFLYNLPRWNIPLQPRAAPLSRDGRDLTQQGFADPVLEALGVDDAEGDPARDRSDALRDDAQR